MSLRKPTMSLTKVLRRSRMVTSLCVAFLPAVGLLSAPAPAQSNPFPPAPGKIFQGETGQPVSSYYFWIHKHPAVYQEFVAWGQYVPAITQDAVSARARMMMAITTAYGSSEAITPGAIARGAGDGWLIPLQSAIAQSHNITYIRLMAEMDNCNNPYAAYSCDGSSRGSDHSTTAFKQAWKRVTVIMRGGSLKHIDAVLGRLHQPRLRTNHDLPRARTAILWVPQVAGNPDIGGDQPSDYWPGRAFVDWVGTDFYSMFPNFSGLESFYNQYPGWPFVFGEYALWGADDPGWVDQLFGWIGSHTRTRMLIYNQGIQTSAPWRLYRYPNSARELRKYLSSSKYPAYAPEWKR